MPTFGNRALGKWSACSVLQALLPLQLDTLFTDPFCLTWQLLLLAVVEQKKKGEGDHAPAYRKLVFTFIDTSTIQEKLWQFFWSRRNFVQCFSAKTMGTVWWGSVPRAMALSFCSVKSRFQLMEKINAAKQLPMWDVWDVCGGAVSSFSGFVLFLAFTGALFRMHLGLQGLVGGIMFGTAFGWVVTAAHTRPGITGGATGASFPLLPWGIFSISLGTSWWTLFCQALNCFFLSSLFLVLCFAAFSVVRAQCSQQSISFAAVCLLEGTT